MNRGKKMMIRKRKPTLSLLAVNSNSSLGVIFTENLLATNGNSSVTGPLASLLTPIELELLGLFS